MSYVNNFDIYESKEVFLFELNQVKPQGKVSAVSFFMTPIGWQKTS